MDVTGSRDAVDAAVCARAASVKALLDADFSMFDTAELLALQSQRHTQAGADALIDARIQAALMNRTTAHEIGAKNWPDVLVTRMRLSAREASGRVRHAETLAPRRSITGDMLEPALPLCAAALAEGSIGEGHVTVIAEAIRMAAKYVDAATCAELEEILVPVAEACTPETVHQTAVTALYLMNQDGPGPDIARHKRGISIGKQDAEGLTRITGWLDAELAAYLGTAMDAWARPGVNNPDDPESPANPDSPTQPEGEPAADPEPPAPAEPADQQADGDTDPVTPHAGADGISDMQPEAPDGETEKASAPAPITPTGPACRDNRSRAQRQHDALKTILRDTIASGRLGQHFGQRNGLPVTVVVSTTLAELETGAGLAITGTGTRLPMPDLIRLAEHAYHYLIVYRRHKAEPLYMGRTRRLATKAQRLLLYDRDRGCTRPGCTHCANNCQAHHAHADWQHGGNTDAPDLTLACPADNGLVNLGWTTSIDNTTGRVHWHPPPLLDTGQTTLNHHFHPEEQLSHPEELLDKFTGGQEDPPEPDAGSDQPPKAQR